MSRVDFFFNKTDGEGLHVSMSDREYIDMTKDGFQLPPGVSESKAYLDGVEYLTRVVHGRVPQPDIQGLFFSVISCIFFPPGEDNSLSKSILTLLAEAGNVQVIVADDGYGQVDISVGSYHNNH